MTKKRVLKVAELFAGVGGFRIGLEGWNGKSATSNYMEDIESNFEVVWSNQFEPLTPLNDIASKIYSAKFPKGDHSNISIEAVSINDIEKHKIDVLVGGFPCQDYSVASLLKNSKGINGKKGALWWKIHDILNDLNKKPDYLILENVDRLINSPSNQKGRDFAIILADLNDLGYAVEWRVINAGDYGFPQRRKRIFIIGYKEGSEIFNQIINKDILSIDFPKTILSESFPIEDFQYNNFPEIKILGSLEEITIDFNQNERKTPFMNSGICWGRKAKTFKVKSPKIPVKSLESILQEDKIPEEFFVDEAVVMDEVKGWAYHKNGKKRLREDKITRFKYWWSEGNMSLTENLKLPTRTIITSEGGKSPSRSRHLIKISDDNNPPKYRRLTPIELERANMFPDNHTKTYNDKGNNKEIEVSASKRAFLMGNALVIGVVEKIGTTIYRRLNKI